MDKPAFITFRHAERHFLAVDNGRAWHITDDAGTNYGTWLDLPRFRARLTAGDETLPLGKAALRVVSIG